MAHTCKHCGGTGYAVCPRCCGDGKLNGKETCYYCQGEGQVKCPACDGTGTVED